MDIISDLKQVITILDKFDNYRDSYPEKVSKIDNKLNDLYHYIENNSLTTNQRYRIVGEIQKVRKERRILKNAGTLLNYYQKNIGKLNNTNNRKFLLSGINQVNKSLGLKYKNRVYSDEELRNIIGE